MNSTWVYLNIFFLSKNNIFNYLAQKIYDKITLNKATSEYLLKKLSIGSLNLKLKVKFSHLLLQNNIWNHVFFAPKIANRFWIFLNSCHRKLKIPAHIFFLGYVNQLIHRTLEMSIRGYLEQCCQYQHRKLKKYQYKEKPGLVDMAVTAYGHLQECISKDRK